MARTTISHTNISDGGTTVSTVAADATNGMDFQNNGNQVLVINNGDTAGKTITIDYAPDSYGRDGSKSISVAAGTEVHIGSFNPVLYNQGTNGNRVHVDFSAGTSVTVAVLSI